MVIASEFVGVPVDYNSSVYSGDLMSRYKLTMASIGLATLMAGAVIAQDQKAQRRERLRNAAEAGAGVVAGLVEEAREEAATPTLSGGLIILQDKPADAAKEVNVGGLVVVRVNDSGSRPPQDIRVQADRQYQPLGRLRGVDEKDGKPLMGGGYTWILLKPVSEGDGAIVVSFTPNDDGTPVKREYKVKVTGAVAATPGN
jgi:hypothetical protein